MRFSKNIDTTDDNFYDLSLVKKMCRGNQEHIIKLVEIFTTQISQSVQEIKVASEKKDLKKFKQEIHKVKPTLTYYGTSKIEKSLLNLDKLIIESFTGKELESNLKSLNKITNQTIAKMKIDFGI